MGRNAQRRREHQTNRSRARVHRRGLDRRDRLARRLVGGNGEDPEDEYMRCTACGATRPLSVDPSPCPACGGETFTIEGWERF